MITEAPPLKINYARILGPMLKRSRYKALYGGRGSMKSHFFAELLVEKAFMDPPLRAVCIREVQKSLKDSAKRLIEDKIIHYGVGAAFNVLTDSIGTPGGGVILFQGMQDHTADSIKSLEGFDVAWAEEAQTLSARSLEILKPTIRKETWIDPETGLPCLKGEGVLVKSEIWASWNPRSASDPIDMFFRGLNPPEDLIIIKTSYKNNPWFPSVMEDERFYAERNNKERYGHIWLGDYEPMAIGAIWNRLTLHNGRREKAPVMARIVVSIDPAISNEDGSNEHGIIICGMGEDKHGYVLEDASMKGGPYEWANRAISMFDKWEADAIVVEINQGGDMVKENLHNIRQGLPVIEVRATRGKHVRAEPIAGMYEQGLVSHVGTFEKLEDQLCQMTNSGYDGEGSPDRADALVWAMTELRGRIVERSASSGQTYVSRGIDAWMS